MSQTSKIISSQYQGQVAGLPNNVQNPVVAGYSENINHVNENWEITAVGGNSITLRNGPVYANPSSESEGAEVIGTPNPYRWQQLSVPGGWYQIATTDGRFVWLLTGPQDGDPVVLRGSSYRGQDSQWGYQPGTA